MGKGIQCWPEGHATKHPCEAEIPDTDHATMRRYGWGFVWARDDGAPSGEGPFYACPEHRSDITEEEREIARELCAKARSDEAAREDHETYVVRAMLEGEGT